MKAKKKARKRVKKRVAERPKGGRPTKYKPRYAELAKKIYPYALTDKRFAEILSTIEKDTFSAKTVSRWAFEYPDFAEARKAGSSLAHWEKLGMPHDVITEEFKFKRGKWIPKGKKVEKDRVSERVGERMAEANYPEKYARTLELRQRGPVLFNLNVIKKYHGKPSNPKRKHS